MLSKQFIQDYFNADFKNIDSVLNDVLVPVFGDYNHGFTEITVATDKAKDMAKAAHIKTIKHVATFEGLGLDIKVFDVTLDDRCHIHQARKNIQALVRQFVEKFEGAFIIFHYEDPVNRSWRFSYLEKRETNAASTNAKRYTYLCGQQYPCRTLAEQFGKLQRQDKTAANLEKAFSVETLSDEFFDEYRNFYQDLVNFVKFENNLLDGFIEYAGGDKDQAEKYARDYIKKLMGRLVFIQFLQNKAWLNNDIHYTHTLFNKCTAGQRENFLDNVLEPLFFGVFNTPKEEREQLFRDEHWDMSLYEEWKDFPYLNGGLFECDELDQLNLPLPSYFFSNPERKDHVRTPKDKRYDDACGIFDFFNRYNFTIDESDPLDTEVGVDPEMLGKIFENLLEDNKDKGTFYTPKEIVQYMCKEALIAYLVDEARRKSEVNKQRQENFEDANRAFVSDPEMTVIRMRQYDKQQLVDLNDSLVEVKICDPAIGSGAFPMGLLNLLMNCRVALNNALGKGEPRAWLKKEIIQKNIYGVDIERGAIDIARLRFWLSIVVDLDRPEALPNFDYKFMQGNSLLEQFEGMDLSNLLPDSSPQNGVIAFSEDTVQQTLLKESLDRYFAETNHDKKLALRANIDRIVKRLIQVRTSGRNDISDLIAPIDVSANDKFFLWHTWFADVFNRPAKQGFDIVIGNPPYLFLSGKGSPVQKLLKQGKENEAIELQNLFDTYKKNYPEASSGCCDFYKWFFALSNRLAVENGVISLITPDTYFNMPKYKDIRALIFGNSVKVLIDLGFHVFDAPCVSSSIIVYKKDNIVPNVVSFVDVKNILKKDNRSFLNSFIEEGTQEISIIDNNISAYKHTIAERIYLDDNDAFDIASDHLKFIEGEHDIQKENLIRYPQKGYVPVLLDGDMSKFSYVEKAYTHSSLEISDIHKGERCILRKTGDTIVVSIPHDFSEAIAHQNVYVVKSIDSTPIKFWFGILNSKMLTFLYQNGLYGQKGRTMAQFRKYALDILPIPIKYKMLETPIVNLVNNILAKKKQNPQADTLDEEHQIDQLVYRLYNLTPEEINLIEHT